MLKHCVAFLMCLCLMSGSGVAFAASSNGCDNDKNEYINPSLALCSTHAYNIGMVENPTDETNRGYMRDMVALKTTIMTQQLNKQYEYLESMIGRFKTQLEKAVLKTKLQTSGAVDSGTSDAASGTVKSDDKFIVLSGTQNCMKMTSIDASLACLQSNVRIAMDAISAGNVRDAAKQLKKDLETAQAFGIDDAKTGSSAMACGSNMIAAKRESVSDCATKLNYALMKKVDERSLDKIKIGKQ